MIKIIEISSPNVSPNQFYVPVHFKNYLVADEVDTYSIISRMGGRSIISHVTGCRKFRWNNTFTLSDFIECQKCFTCKKQISKDFIEIFKRLQVYVALS